MGQRQEFLEKVWKSYPTSSGAPLTIKGRFFWVNVDENLGEIEIDLQKSDLLLGLDAHLEEGQAHLAKDILGTGDWIEVLQGLGPCIIRLLAPCWDATLLQDVVLSKRKSYQHFQEFKEKIRQHFLAEKFHEMTTPTLVVCPGTEPTLDPFVTEFQWGSHRKTLFLPTSPELSLKKNLAQGFAKIFEIKSCFRNGEKSSQHHPEFQMLEWYRSFATLESLREDLKTLVRLFSPEVKNTEFVQKTMQDLFQEMLGESLIPGSTAADLREMAARLNLAVDVKWDFDDIFFYIYVEKIEPRLKQFKFLFLEKYPPSQAALARLTTDGWGDRFEFYMDGVEIANAFHELNDPEVQRQRFSEDLAKKEYYQKMPVPLDEEFLQALEGGMPPSSGIALGLERLFMVLNKLDDIQGLNLWPDSLS